jgi:hypothetical protein
MRERLSNMENELNIKEKMLVGKHIEIMELESQLRKRKADVKENECAKERPEKSLRIENPQSSKAPRNVIGALNTIHVVHEDYGKNVNDKLNIDIILDYMLNHNFIQTKNEYITGQATNKCIFMKFKSADLVDKLVERRYFSVLKVDVKISRARTELQWLPPQH